jgi:general secretion pathway protein F
VPTYSYKGMTSAGRPTKGSLTAESLAVARARMRQQGVFLTDILESQESEDAQTTSPEGGRFNIDLSFLKSIPVQENATATRQLSTLVGAGIPLVESLTAVVEQTEHPRLRAILSQVRDKVNEGSPYADAMDSTNQFDSLFISMVRAGEAGGALGLVLERVADYQENQAALTSKVISIIAYPLAMLGFAGLVVAVLVTFVLPQITGLLVDLGQELPWYTRLIISLSDVMRNYWWALIMGVAASVLAFRSLLATERGRGVFDRVSLRMPVMGRIVRAVAISRFSSTLSTLLASGVGIVQALEISKHVAKNQVISDAIDDARTSVLEGASLAAPLRSSGHFPPMVVTMIEVGERSGEVSSMLAKVAATYDQQVENSITRMTALLEPLLILLMVGIVLVIIMATLVPLLSITSSMA